MKKIKKPKKDKSIKVITIEPLIKSDSELALEWWNSLYTMQRVKLQETNYGNASLINNPSIEQIKDMWRNRK
jgi:hypothetical protein